MAYVAELGDCSGCNPRVWHAYWFAGFVSGKFIYSWLIIVPLVLLMVHSALAVFWLVGQMHSKTSERL
jgi:hypothetical protein